MHHENPIIRESRQPIQSGINRRLITSNYQMGSTFVLQDLPVFDEPNNFEIAIEEPQYM